MDRTRHSHEVQKETPQHVEVKPTEVSKREEVEIAQRAFDLPVLMRLRTHLEEIRNVALTMRNSELLGEFLTLVAQALILLLKMQREEDNEDEIRRSEQKAEG